MVAATAWRTAEGQVLAALGMADKGLAAVRIMNAISDAMLDSHVDACTRGHSPELTTDPRHYQGCGNGWYCKRGGEIRNLEA